MTSAPSLATRAVAALYRLALLLYPAAFRRAYGREMVAVFVRASEERRARGAAAAARFWCRAFAELPGSALRLRRARPAARRPRPTAGPSSHRPTVRRSTMRSTLQDVRFAFRTLRRTPGITAVALVTLALGIGANTAIFSTINGVLFHPLSAPDPERLVMVMPVTEESSSWPVSYDDFRDWESQATSFAALGAIRPQSVAVTGGGREPERIRGLFVTSGFFGALGEAPEMGRPILAGEDAPGAPRTAVLSHRFWQRRWGGDPQILGQQVLLNNYPHTIVGVMGADFRFPFDDTDAWISIQTFPGTLDRANTTFWTVGRLRDGVTLEKASEEMEVVAGRIAEEYPAPDRPTSASVNPLSGSFVRGDDRMLFWILLGAVGMVLLIGTVNVANLQLARATGRGREMAVRTALGCGRSRLVRQLLTESVLLAVAGGLLGVGVAVGGVKLLLAYGPSWIGSLYTVRIDRGVLAFVGAVTLLTSVLFGLAPALSGSRVEVTAGLREGGRTASEGRGRNRLRGALVVAQTALAVMLLIGAGLLLQSFTRLSRLELGFNRDNLLTVQFRLPDNKYDSDEAIVAFFDRMLETVAAVPGVEGVASALGMPFTADEGRFPLLADGVDPGPDRQLPSAFLNIVSPNYFRTMGVPLVAGRGFESGDRLGNQLAAVISRSVAETLWPGEDPIGHTLGVRGDPMVALVVGVVGDIRGRDLERGWTPYVYVPYTQSPARFATIAVRVPSAPASYAAPVREAIWSLDPDQPLWEVMTQDERIGFWLASQRFASSTLTVFAAAALLLAATGLAGVIAYMVGRRRHEFGVRLALGATRSDVVGLVLRTGGLLLVAGVAVGLAGALALNRVLAGLLFGVGSVDAATFAAAPLLLVAVGLAATWLPARRAARVDPVVALRSE